MIFIFSVFFSFLNLKTKYKINKIYLANIFVYILDLYYQAYIIIYYKNQRHTTFSFPPATVCCECTHKYTLVYFPRYSLKKKVEEKK